MAMFLQGLAGMLRRMYGGGAAYLPNQHVLGYNRMISVGAWGLGLFQLAFIINFFWSLKRGEKVNDNPWEATTLEWNTPTPPPHGNFAKIPTAFRGPYEYSLPGSETHKDYYPQW